MAEREKSSRLDYTMFVNHCVVPAEKEGKGYQINVKTPVYQEWHAEYRDRYGKDLQKGEPYELFAWRVCQGNFAALDSMIARGIVRKKKGKDLQHLHVL